MPSLGNGALQTPICWLPIHRSQASTLSTRLHLGSSHCGQFLQERLIEVELDPMPTLINKSMQTLIGKLSNSNESIMVDLESTSITSNNSPPDADADTPTSIEKAPNTSDYSSPKVLSRKTTCEEYNPVLKCQYCLCVLSPTSSLMHFSI